MEIQHTPLPLQLLYVVPNVSSHHTVEAVQWHKLEPVETSIDNDGAIAENSLSKTGNPQKPSHWYHT